MVPKVELNQVERHELKEFRSDDLDDRRPHDWSTAQPDYVDFATLNFRSEQVRQTVQDWEALIEQVRDKRSTKVSWYRGPYEDRSVRQWWCTDPQLVKPSGRLRSMVRDGKSTVDYFCIHCGTNKWDVSQPDWTAMSAQAWAANDVSVEFQVCYGRSEFVQPELLFCVPAEDSTIRITYFPDFYLWKRTMKFGDVNYDYLVELPDTVRRRSVVMERLVPRFRALTSSAESFRDSSYEMLDELEHSITTDVLADFAVRSVYSMTEHWAGRDGEPPQIIWQRRARPLGDQERQEVLETARREIAGRRKLIAKHFGAMHAALNKLGGIDQYLRP